MYKRLIAFDEGKWDLLLDLSYVKKQSFAINSIEIVKRKQCMVS
jgi:hypothetical protein